MKEALAGNTAVDFTAVIDVRPMADEVLKAKGVQMTAPPAGYKMPATWTTTGQLDPASGLLVAQSSHGGEKQLRLSAPAMEDIVAALKIVFPDSKIEFARAAPSSEGKHVLSINWA